MPRIRRSDDSGSKFIGFRLDRDTADFYSKRAKANGSTLSEFLRNMIVQGMIAESAYEVEQRLRGLVDEIHAGRQTGDRAGIPDELLLSAFTSEHLLTAIVEARDIQKLYEAQDAAKARLAEFKGVTDGKT
jgi:hypothetical protein